MKLSLGPSAIRRPEQVTSRVWYGTDQRSSVCNLHVCLARVGIAQPIPSSLLVASLSPHDADTICVETGGIGRDKR
eukprot:scaffold823_cov219-Amphora_coffeaeformis.AAC.21